jgi:hypothetical protein
MRLESTQLLGIDIANRVLTHRLGLLLANHGSLDNAHIWCWSELVLEGVQELGRALELV